MLLVYLIGAAAIVIICLLSYWLATGAPPPSHTRERTTPER
jgi:hypothetical protein